MRLLNSLIFICSSILMMHAQANDNLNALLEQSLEDLMSFEVVTPTRTKISRREAPGNITVVSREQILNSGARTIPELLRTMPGVNVRWNPMVQTVDVRGFGASPFTSRILILIDGVPYNSWNKGGFPQHPGLDFFNLNYVKHLELVRGPGSALYGENAFNAVLNIVTLSGQDEGTNLVSAEFGDRDTQSFSATRNTQLGNADFFLGARDFTGQLPTTLWENDGMGNVQGYDLFTKLNYGEFEFTYYRLVNEVDGYVEHPGGFPPGTVFRSAEEIEQSVNIIGFSYQHVSESGRLTAELQGSHAQREGSSCAACHAPAQTPESTLSSDHGYQNYIEGHLNYQVNENHEVMVGAEWRELEAGEWLDMDYANRPETPITSYDKYALFVQDQIHAGPLSLVAGVRYDSEASEGYFKSEWFPRLDAVYALNEHWTLRAQWGQAARYPSFTERYQNTWFLAAETPNFPIVLAEFEPNFDLRPEYIETISFSGEYTGEHFRIRLDAYQNDIENFITIAYPRFRFENHPQDARVSGLEIDWDWQLTERLSAFGNYALQEHRRRGSGVDSAGSELAFTYAPRHKVNLGLTYRAGEDLTVTLTNAWKGEFIAPDFWYPIALGTSPEPLDGYALTNLNAVWRLPLVIRGRRPMTLNLAINNLGNATPIETLLGVGSDLTGRDFRLELEYQFDD